MVRQDDFFSICGRCKIICCREARPPVTPERAKIIEEVTGIPSDKFTEFKDGYLSMKEECVFLKSGMCSIQGIKPETCVAGPVTFDVDYAKGVVNLYLKKEAICPLAGALYRDEDRLRQHISSATKEILHLIRNIPENELQAIMKIEEPDTFKITECPLPHKMSDGDKGPAKKHFLTTLFLRRVEMVPRPGFEHGTIRFLCA